MADFRVWQVDQWGRSTENAKALYDGFGAPGAVALNTPANGSALSTSLSNSSDLASADRVIDDGATSAYSIVAAGDAGVGEYLYLSDFGFAIPSGATILGVEILVDVYSSSNDVRLETVQLALSANAATLSAENRATETRPADGTNIFGGSSDLFGEGSLTPATVNSSDFGVVLRSSIAAGEYGGQTISLSAVGIRITYSATVDDSEPLQFSYQAVDVLTTTVDDVRMSMMSVDVLETALAPLRLSFLQIDVIRSVTGDLPGASDKRRRLLFIHGD